MKKRIAVATVAACVAGAASSSALDSVQVLVGSNDPSLQALSHAVLDASSDLSTYPTDNDATQPGNQPIVLGASSSNNVAEGEGSAEGFAYSGAAAHLGRGGSSGDHLADVSSGAQRLLEQHSRFQRAARQQGSGGRSRQRC